MEAYENIPANQDDDKVSNRDLFSRIQPRTSYNLDELVCHKDGIIYRVRAIGSNGRYILGYVKDGNDVKIEAILEDFRHFADMEEGLFLDLVHEGEITPDQILGADVTEEPPNESEIAVLPTITGPYTLYSN